MRVLDSPAQLGRLLRETPAVLDGDPLFLAELDNVSVEGAIRAYVVQADSTAPVPDQPTVLLGPPSSYYDRWPVVSWGRRVPQDLMSFNRALFRNYDAVLSYSFCQSKIPSMIEEDLDADAIVLVVFDGLSYGDWVAYPDVKPCVVEGPTITPVGFQRIIGRPSIAQRLFKRGVRGRLGFSHWGRDEGLTNTLFKGFDTGTQMRRVREFSEVLSGLGRLPGRQSYVQIVTNGLDSICHRHRGRPPVAAIAKHLYEDLVLALAERLHRLHVGALVYVCADHGILWRPLPDEDELEITTSHQAPVGSHRYCKGNLLVGHSRHMSAFGRNYTVLEYPYVLSSLGALEWGVHGGISFQESVVPWLKMEVR